MPDTSPTAYDTDPARRLLYGLTTDAVVLHCPGPLRAPAHPVHDQWGDAQTVFFHDRTTVESCTDDPRLTILTYNTRNDPSLLERCAERLGIAVVVLGRGLQDWRWEYKIWLVRDYLATAGSVAHVMCLDADDVLILASPRTILRRFEKSGARILFSSTAWDWPHSDECRKFEWSVAPDAHPAHRHLNAGAFIGEAECVRECLDEIANAIESGATWCRSRHGFDDQLAWRELHRRAFPSLRVDTDCSVFVRFDGDR